MEDLHQITYSLRDSTTGQAHLISYSGTRIGRIPENDIVVPTDNVSRYHAVLWVQNGALHIRDEGSTNGTWVNGERVRHSTRLELGSKVRIADREFEVVEQLQDSSFSIPVYEDQVLDLVSGSRGSWVPYMILGTTIVIAVLGLLLGQFQHNAAAIDEVPTTLRNVETRVPLPTLTIEPTTTPTLVPTETPVPTALPVTASPAYAAPRLLSPDNGHAHGGTQGPLLQWHAEHSLTDPFSYRIVVDYSHDGGSWREIGWSQDLTWRVPEYVGWLLSEPWKCEWYVEVVRVEERDASGKPTRWTEVSESSESWTFSWPQ